MQKPLDPTSADGTSLKIQTPGNRRNPRCADPAVAQAAYDAWLHRSPDAWLHRSPRYAECRNPQTQERLGPILAWAFLACCIGSLYSQTRGFDWTQVIVGMVVGPAIMFAAILICWMRDREREGQSRPDCTCPACIEAQQRRRAGKCAPLKSAKAKDTTGLFDEL